MRVYAGTYDVEGGVVVSVDYDEIKIEKNGEIYWLVNEKEWPMTCFCDGCCRCEPSTYIRAYKEVSDKPKGKK